MLWVAVIFIFFEQGMQLVIGHFARLLLERPTATRFDGNGRFLHGADSNFPWWLHPYIPGNTQLSRTVIASSSSLERLLAAAWRSSPSGMVASASTHA